MKTSFANRAPSPLPSDQLSCYKTFILFHEKKKILVLDEFWLVWFGLVWFGFSQRISFNKLGFIDCIGAFTWWEHETQLMCLHMCVVRTTVL